MQELGCKMVGVSDAFGAIRSDDGIDANALYKHIVGRRQAHRVRRRLRRRRSTPDDLLEIPCDVFIPAALGGMIHEDNADRIQAAR